MMGWMYMLVCTMDMVIFPVLWSLLQTTTGTAITQWNPLTLQGAGLFHIAMGAVLGIAAFGRTQEKLGGANNGGAQLPSSGAPAFGAPQAGFGAAPGGFGSPAPAFGATPTSSFGNNVPVGFGGAPKPAASFGTPAAPMMSSTGKPMPMQPDQPEL
jgi:hypothetical protein